MKQSRKWDLHVLCDDLAKYVGFSDRRFSLFTHTISAENKYFDPRIAKITFLVYFVFSVLQSSREFLFSLDT